jgi:hypothetical protein
MKPSFAAAIASGMADILKKLVADILTNGMRLEPLSEANDPELYRANNALRRLVEAKSPGDAPARVYIYSLPVGESARALIPEAIVRYFENNAQYQPANWAQGYEKISIGRWAVEHHAIPTLLTMLGHEYGHDMLNHYLRKGESLPSLECEADHYMASLMDYRDFEKFLASRPFSRFTPVEIPPLPALSAQDVFDHPYNEERIAALKSDAIRSLPTDVRFNADCSVATPLVPPNFSGQSTVAAGR